MNHREMLKSIRTFSQLIVYLRDELDWPITQHDFEDMTFEYTPEELGIDLKVAAKIQEIRRLRPLSVQQPWGIFFVKFEPKRLPVVAMRRMLKAVALKKRATAESAERLAWKSDDLLFISNYGEEENRQITFAHFTHNEIKKDLPTRKVLGWDNRDTPLRLDHVADSLNQYLSWPSDEHNNSAWRKAWRSAFSITHHEVIDTSKKLSIELAKLARNIRNRINTVLAIETDNGPITKLKDAFKEALVHDLDDDGFADMYAQTIAYGLLSARISNPAGKTSDDFSAAMPVTNPFLKELMETFIDVGGRESKKAQSIRLDFDELGVSEVVDLLDVAKMGAVVRDFGDKNPQEDPVIHFYELFLKEYDAEKRMQRGVFYTPRPIVTYIVKAVDNILQNKYGLENGLADITSWMEMTQRIEGLEIPIGISPQQPFVQILDPATGTGTFIVEVIDIIHRRMLKKWRKENKSLDEIEKLWNDYVPQNLLPRIHGYELMMAPYAIAHMKIGLKLSETGYLFECDERAQIYLTNSLEASHDYVDSFAFAIPALAHEATAVNEIKKNKHFTVVIGNPPYSVSSHNKSEFIEKLMVNYKAGLESERNIQPLSDDYIKFIRFSQNLIEKAGLGILGFITNHSYISGVIHRSMRKSLLETFSEISISDLHGNSFIKEYPPDDIRDTNVFDIQQGVSLFIGSRENSHSNVVRFCELWGTGLSKLNQLSASTEQLSSIELTVDSEYAFFVPKDFSMAGEYTQWSSISDVFTINQNGIQTGHDAFSVGFSRNEVAKRVEEFFDPKLSNAEVSQTYKLGDNSGWIFSQKRQKLLGSKLRESLLVPYYYRPFDCRRIYYEPNLLKRPSPSIMPHLVEGQNLALFTMRKVVPTFAYSFFGVVNSVVDHGYFYMGNQGSSSCFPLYIQHDQPQLLTKANYTHNFNPGFCKRLAQALHTKTTADNLPEGTSPEDIFNYIYAVFHSPIYRKKYAEFLRIEFPRLPLPMGKEVFINLASLGHDLVQLHLMKSPKLAKYITSSKNVENTMIKRIGWANNTIMLDQPNKMKGDDPIAETPGFHGANEAVWNFQMGGYQVCHKWLKDRKGHTLSEDDIDRYQKIIVAISETINIMDEIDTTIQTHGGWPGAFQAD